MAFMYSIFMRLGSIFANKKSLLCAHYCVQLEKHSALSVVPFTYISVNEAVNTKLVVYK
jgi:hypothetical protein